MITSEHLKVVGDFASGGVVVATIFQWLPAVAAVFSIIYTALRIYEWFEKRNRKSKGLQ